MLVSMQGLKTLLLGLRSRLIGLINNYCLMSEMKGLLDEEQIINIVATQPAERSGCFVFTD